MESKMSWWIKNPSFYLGSILLLIFGSQCLIGYVKEHKVYVLESILSIVGFLMITITVMKKLAQHSHKKST
ncbi:hypothetical protein [Priestia aryabhattai]|uniref:hypothetical protein n=1 Tax=Priestia aryabhattai TaxID=412384 RepID=UPI001AD95980|nr:hypothetical protein [Priestia aryabhattai]QTL52654.1 hypothetical protein J5Z55_29095 [Priestia aryabhattai]